MPKYPSSRAKSINMSYHGELDGKVTPRCISIAQDLRLIDGKAV